MRRLLLALWALSAFWVIAGSTVWTPRGFTRTVFAGLGERGAATTAQVRDADVAFMGRPHGPRRNFSARWRGIWYVDRAGTYTLFLGADDWARLSIDGEVLGERSRQRGYGTVPFVRHLTAGPHTIDIQFEQEGGGGS